MTESSMKKRRERMLTSNYIKERERERERERQ